MFCHLHLRTIEAAQDRIEHVARGEIVQVTIDESLDRMGLFITTGITLAIQGQTISKISRSGDGIDRDDAFDAHLLKNIDWQRVRNAAIDVEFAIDLNGNARTRNRAARMHGSSDFARGEDHTVQAGQMSRDNSKRANQFRKMNIANRTFEALLHFFAAQKALSRKDERIN